MLKKQTIFFYMLALLSLPAFSQTSDPEFYPGFYQPKAALTDTLTRILKLEPILDSIRKTAKRDTYKPLSLAFICIFIDTLRSDSVSSDKVSLVMNTKLPNVLGTYKVKLPKKHRLNIRSFNLNLREGAGVYTSPDSQTEPLFKRGETDELTDLALLEQYTDKARRLWFKYSFTLSRTKPLNNGKESAWSGKETLVGWSLVGNLSIDFCTYQ